MWQEWRRVGKKTSVLHSPAQNCGGKEFLTQTTKRTRISYKTGKIFKISGERGEGKMLPSHPNTMARESQKSTSVLHCLGSC